jgi:Na+/proline symporter
MPSAMTLAILAFVGVQLGIGYWASKRVAEEDDYLVAGRRLGAGAAGFSLFVTWFGAESILGSAAAIHVDGLSGGRADPLGYALSLLLFGALFAARLWRTGAMTLADVYRTRFGRSAERVAAFVLIPPSILWSGAQIRALGQILSFQSPIGLETAIGALSARNLFDYEAPFLLSLVLSIATFILVSRFEGIGPRSSSTI